MRETLATILWEGWTALVLCTAAVFLPGSRSPYILPPCSGPGWCWRLLCLQAGCSGRWQSGLRPCPRNS